MDSKVLQLLLSPEKTTCLILRHPGSTIAEISRRENIDASLLVEAIKKATLGNLVRKGLPRICNVNDVESVTWWPVTDEECPQLPDA